MQQIRTSTSHPLYIADISLPEMTGRIGMTLCPGKCCESYFGYTWQRSLVIDMQVVQDWGADILVTLMEEDELKFCQVDTIGDCCTQLGIEWHHLPIRDVDIPDQHFEKNWVYAGTRLRRNLRNGKNILLHCRGGLGRTGTIAARLLIELGWDSEEVIDTIRQLRPGAIETRTQETYVQSCRSIKESDCNRHSRFIGCLFGGAIGDALGYLVEFDRIDAIRKKYGSQGVDSPVKCNKVTVSDDTQMTLFTLEGLLRSQGLSPKKRVNSIRNAYLDWYRTQTGGNAKKTFFGTLGNSPSLQVCRAPGNTCLDALAAGGNGRIDKPINNSKGCGSVMRVAPVGLLSGNLGQKHVFELGMRTGALTHGHVTSFLSAGAMACIIFGLIKGEDLREAAHSTCDILKGYPGHEETSLAISKALEATADKSCDHPYVINDLWGDPELKDNTSRGWVAEEALSIGLYSALQGKSYTEVIQIAANHNGDSDSTASVAGQLYGAWKGIEVVPHDWITKLDVYEEIIGLVYDSSQ